MWMFEIRDRQFALRMIGLFAALCLISALIAQYVFGIMPCHLCLYERYVYGALAVIGLASIFWYHRFLFYAAGLVIILGVTLAVYHSGVEMNWWQASRACVADNIMAENFEDFQAKFVQKPLASCNQVSWVIFGVSATIWNVIVFALFGLFFWRARVKFLS